MNVYKISCGEVLAPIECIAARRNRWAVRWDHHHEDEGWFAYEFITDHRPTVDEIREIIEGHIDEATQNEIVNGFVWNGKKIRLSDTTQRNFLFAVFEIDKTGSVDRAPFIGLLESETDAEAADELGDITLAMWRHIKARRAEGIELKRAVDYSQYEL